MKTDQVKKLSTRERYLYWIKERESIRLLRYAKKPKPWTGDEILQTYRFTNVRRMDDKVSHWLLMNWYEPYRDRPTMLLACALARFINLPSSLAAVGFPSIWSPGKVKQTLRQLRGNGRTIFNGAYMIRGNDGQDKIESVVDYYVGPLADVDSTFVNIDSMEKTWANLVPCYGFGSFMAGQVVADLRWALTGSWADKDDWAPKGPGSRRGMNRLSKRDTGTAMTQEEFMDGLKVVMEICRKELPSEITSRLEAMDYQNTLCEWDKYERTLWGEGRPKALFRSLV